MTLAHSAVPGVQWSGVEALTTTHRNCSGSSGISVPHSTPELIDRAFAKEGQRLRWRSRQAFSPVTVALSQKNQSRVAHILFLSASRTVCASPAAVSALDQLLEQLLLPRCGCGGWE